MGIRWRKYKGLDDNEKKRKEAGRKRTRKQKNKKNKKQWKNIIIIKQLRLSKEEREKGEKKRTEISDIRRRIWIRKGREGRIWRRRIKLKVRRKKKLRGKDKCWGCLGWVVFCFFPEILDHFTWQSLRCLGCYVLVDRQMKYGCL